MAQTPEGARKVAAKRLGLALNEYDARMAAGEKWCGRCREWQPVVTFGIDRSRGDGLASHCADSRVASIGKPGARERRKQAALGLAWCRGCEVWLPADAVRQGVCKAHAAAQARTHYAANRAAILPRKRTESRARDQLEPIPGWWQKEKLAEFDGRCAYGCGMAAIGFDHIWPVSRGGKSEPSNLVPACKPCNSGKKDRDPGPWLCRFAAAFPDQFEELVALSFEHPSSLDMLEVA
jgi:5-methylcytosine-specific restriction endonuclease McrA